MAGMNFGLDTTYAVEGDKVVIASPMGVDEPMTLTMKGDTLEGDLDGDHLVFRKK
jgi:hypothetical protein